MQLVHVESSIVKQSNLTPNYQYFVTTNSQLLNQFYTLIESFYQKHYCKQFCISKEERIFDQTFGKVIVVVNEQGRVIGGARLILVYPENPILLPIENDALSLRQRFPKLALAKHTYGEWGRYIVAQDLQHKSYVSANIAKMCYQLAAMAGCNYLFFITQFALKVRLRRFFLQRGVLFKELLTSDEMPHHIVYKNSMHYLSMLDLTAKSFPTLDPTKSKYLHDELAVF